MSAVAAILAGRALAEDQMLDSCHIERWLGTTSTDPTTGVVTKDVALIYPAPPLTGSGKCRVQNRAPRTQSPNAGETVAPQHLVELQVPMSAIGIRTGDVATIDASDLDPDLAGRRWRITVPVHKSYATARRLPCTEGGFDA